MAHHCHQLGSAFALRICSFHVTRDGIIAVVTEGTPESGEHHSCLTPRAILEMAKCGLEQRVRFSPSLGPSLASFLAEVGGYACVWLYG
jgi:hypothetical protein